MLKTFITLAKTEFKLSLRSIDALLFGMAMPVVIMVLIAVIYADPANPDHTGMMEKTFGAFLSIGIAAVGLMALPLVLSDYRERGILKRLKVTPAHPALLLGAQLAVQGFMALLSASAVVLVATLAFGFRPVGNGGRIVLAYALVLISIFSIGLLIASTARDSKRAGLWCSLAYFPMLVLSGTTVPFPVFPEGLRRAASVLPLRQGIVLLNGAVAGDPLSAYPIPIVVLGGLSVVCLTISMLAFRWESQAR